MSAAGSFASGMRSGELDDYGTTGLAITVTSQANTRTGKDIMHTGNGVESERYLDPNNEPVLEGPVPAGDAGKEETAIAGLLAVAGEFNAAFNTALYELEASRKLAKERSARIEELNESITSLNTALQAELGESLRKDESHARESEALNQAIRELESERDRLRQQIAEQQKSLDVQAGEIAGLTSRLAELTTTLERNTADSLRAAEAHAREIQDSDIARAALQEKYDAGCEQLSWLQAELETRTNELAGFSGQVDALAAELAALTAAGQQREAAHREESDRLHKELQSLNEQLRTREEQLQQSASELESRAGEIASLVAIQSELGAHVEKLENLNRALHDSSNSENDVHRKVIAEKDAAISALKARLETVKRTPHGAAANSDAEGELKSALQELEARLQESEAQARMFAERAGMADDLAAQVEHLNRELQAYRAGGEVAGASSSAPAQNQGGEPVRSITDRDRFVAHLNKLLAGQDRSGAMHNLMYVLLDNFMRVRDEIGVMNTGQVIDETSAIIESSCDGNDLITRFGDCTFAVLCNGTSTDDMQKKAERIRSTIEKHIFEVAGRTLVTSASIGICAVRGSDSDAEQVISRADLACESARLSGGNQVVMNGAVSDEPSLPDSNTRYADIVDKILSENRIKIYYQPISNLKENSIDCLEVLTRVIDENSNIILPREFFSMAVNSGKAVEVDRHIIESVLKTLAGKPNPDMKLFIKLTRQSVSCHGLPLWVSNKLDEYRINPGQLVFEVTEQVMASDLKNLSQLSRELNKIGCKIAIEHYRLETQPQHLHHIHPEYLKIDSELVQNISKKGRGLAKLNEIMDLARMNNLITIAEGVENPACLAILWELGVSFAQGYFISEPTDKATFPVHEVDSEQAVARDGKATYTIG